MKRWIGGAVVVGVALTIFALVRMKSDGAVSESSEGETADAIISPSNVELFGAMDKVLTAARHDERPGQLSPALEKLLADLGSDELGTRTRKGFLEFMAEVSVRGEHARFERTALVRGWLAHPDQGFDEIRSLLKRVSAREHPEFRAELVRMAGLLPSSHDSGVRDLAEAEVRENVVTGAFEAVRDGKKPMANMALVVGSFQVAIEHSRDEGQALDFTVDNIARQPDPLVRMSLLSTFLGRFPKQERALEAALSARGIEHPERSMASLPAASAPVSGAVELPEDPDEE